ncbi:MAG: hypothetical protein JWN41_1692 [Thermoleophilia bacterium]|nr:hypothetical protein [Thermoleophilia bacterium]
MTAGRRLRRGLKTATAMWGPTPVEAALLPSDATDRQLRSWAGELGVQPDLLRKLIAVRAQLVSEVAEDPLAWGFGLLPRGIRPRDLVEEFRERTRTRGDLAESFITGHPPLLALMPEHLGVPGGRPIALEFVVAAGLAPDAAYELASHLRATLQARLGRPLDADAVSHAVREIAWDHQLDAALVTGRVLAVLRDVV